MDEVFERAKKQNEMDHERMIRDFEREKSIEQQRKKNVFLKIKEGSKFSKTC